MKQRVKSFDGLRAIAIGLVLVGHLLGQYHLEGTAVWAEIVGNAGLGVRLFFVLSGFLITSLLMREHAETGTVAFGSFLARRSIRILPAFYVYLLVVYVLHRWVPFEISGQQFATAAAYSWNYHCLWLTDAPAQGQWFLGHLWTLALEEQFYLVWPLVIILLGWKRAKHLSWMIPAVMPVVRIACYYAFPGQRGALGMMFHTAIDSILIGCAFALWRESLTVRIQRWSWAVPVAVVFVAIIAPVVSFYVRQYRITVGFGLEAVCVGVVLLHLYGKGAGTQWLSSGAMVWLGKLSYSIYLWQQLFLTNFQVKPLSQFPLSLLLAVAAGMVSYYVVEQPCLRLKKRFERVALEA